mgnify:CR=1 FL=1
MNILNNDSDLEMLSDSDDDDVEDYPRPGLIVDTHIPEVNVAETEDMEIPRKKTKTSVPTRRFIWKNEPFPFREDVIPSYETEDPLEVQPLQPIDYFLRYFTDEHFENAAKYTKIYAHKSMGSNLRTDEAEIRRFYGIHLFFGVIKLPRMYMYWDSTLGHDMVKKTMSRSKFFLLRKCIHYLDTAAIPNDVPGNRLWKVQPILDAVRTRCLAITRNFSNYSVDEQMIPFTGRCPNSLRQFVKSKPRPVGLKNFVITSSTGIVLDFEIYQGTTTPLGDRSLGLGPAVILRLCETIPRNSFLYFDRYFTTIPLLQRLHEIGLNGTGTIMGNRMKEPNFLSDKQMKRGDVDQKVRSDQKVVGVKWMDNKSVLMSSNCVGKDPITKVQRWDKNLRTYVLIDCPAIVSRYNKMMGGVDICDQLIEYYRTWIKSKKWTLKVALHFIDLACVNSWMEYKEDMKRSNKKCLDLLHFRLEVAEALCSSKPKLLDFIDDISDDETNSLPSTSYSPLPGGSKRFDCIHHWPVIDKLTTARMCRLKGWESRTRTRCEKCNIYLCFLFHRCLRRFVQFFFLNVFPYPPNNT